MSSNDIGNLITLGIVLIGVFLLLKNAKVFSPDAKIRTDDKRNDIAKGVLNWGFFILTFGCLFGYFVPAWVANSRKHKNAGAISILNFFLGWTIIGWVVALVWANTDSSTQKIEPAKSQSNFTVAEKLVEADGLLKTGKITEEEYKSLRTKIILG